MSGRDDRREPSPAQAAALKKAALRPRGTLCPVIGARGFKVNAAAETALLESLYRRGWAENPNGCRPVITDAGRAAIANATGEA